MRRLLPARLYPGQARVGAGLTSIQADARIPVFDGIDWFWIPSILRATLFLKRQRPEVIVLQWWSGSVLHSYLALALLAKLLGARLVIEFHEIVDTGEANIPIIRRYVRAFAPLLMRLADGYTVHSTFDQDLVRDHYPVGSRPIQVLPHGPYEHYGKGAEGRTSNRPGPTDALNILFFGVIRPYKGLEHLVQAFDLLEADEVEGFWLTVVGETWEGWTLPSELIASSRYRDRIAFENRYVHDDELDGYLAGADAVVLPYLRSSMSGPLHVAMGYGLPIIITDVGGNPESSGGYEGLLLVPPADPQSLVAALRRLRREYRDKRFAHPVSWDQTAEAYDVLFERLGVAGRKGDDTAR